ncbi:TPA_asm: hypothetical protein [Psilorhabdovirus 2]|nr:TPA_asm: hypothetical protein [Psilorhabdovirus 2]
MHSLNQSLIPPQAMAEMNAVATNFVRGEQAVDSATAAARIPGPYESYRTQMEQSGGLPNPFDRNTVQPVLFYNSLPYSIGPQGGQPVVKVTQGYQRIPDIVENKKGSNPYIVNKHKYPMIVPRGSYQGNQNVKSFLVFFKQLAPNDQRLIDRYIDFQMSGVINRLIEKHNQEVDTLKAEIQALKETCSPTYSPESDSRDNEDLTKCNKSATIREWDEVSVWQLVNEDMTEYNFSLDDSSGKDNPDSETPKPDMTQAALPPEVTQISVLAPTAKGFVKVRVGKIPGYTDKVEHELKKLNALKFLTSVENRESGVSFMLVYGMISKYNPGANKGPFLVSQVDVHRAVSKFKSWRAHQQNLNNTP